MASNTHGGRRSQIANYILITAAVLLLLAYPFQDFFVGGLLTHLAGAALIGGLADCPVIAVPTSIGYGASFGGVSALLSMLNSCASGVSVVNIDNGFGAGYLASMINHITEGKKS